MSKEGVFVEKLFLTMFKAVARGCLALLLFFAIWPAALQAAPWIEGTEVTERVEIADYIMLDGALPELVKAENPVTPAVVSKEIYGGGIDAGSPGDRSAFSLASPKDVRWFGGTVMPEAISVFFYLPAAADMLEVELGYYADVEQTHKLDILLDGSPVSAVTLPGKRSGNNERGLKESRFRILLNKSADRPKYHVLCFQQSESWGRFFIDAIRIRGAGIRLLDPESRVFLSRSDLQERLVQRTPRLPDKFSLPGSTFAFDFGNVDSPVWTEGGFVGVNECTAYNGETGYGWIGNLSSLKAGKCAISDDKLRRDYVLAKFTGKSAPQFRVDLEPGRYRFFVISGGLPDATAPDFSIRIGQQSLKMSLSSLISRGDAMLNRPGYLHNRFEFEVDKSGSTVISFPDGYLLLNAAVIYPVMASALMEPQLASLVESYYLPAGIRAKEPLLKPGDGKDKIALLPSHRITEGAGYIPSNADKKRGYTIFVHTLERSVYPDSLPRQDELLNTLFRFATPGEYVAFPFAARTHSDLKGATISVSDLRYGQRVIPSKSITLNYVAYVKSSITGVPSGLYREAPKMLYPVVAEDLPADFVRDYRLLLKVPEDTAAGLYKGKVHFEGANFKRTSLDIELEVLPFKLAELKDRFVGVYWHPEIWTVSGEDRLEAQLADMAAHGVNAATSYGDGIRPYIEGDELKIDFSRMKEIMRLRKKHGITGPIPFHQYLGGVISRLGFKYRSQAFERHYKRMIELIVKEAAAEGWPEILFYPLDEPSVTEFSKEGPYLCGLIKSVPGAKTYITTTAGGLWNTAGRAADIYEWLDIPAFAYHESADIEKIRKEGKRYLYYVMGYGPLYTQVDNTRFLNGFQFWASGAEAIYYWVYNWPIGDPLFDLDGYMKETGLVVCSESGYPIPTLWWEGVREGIYDLRYMMTLESLLGNMDEGELKSRGEAILRKAKESFPAGTNAGRRVWAELERDPQSLDKVRRKTAYFLKEAYAGH